MTCISNNIMIDYYVTMDYDHVTIDYDHVTIVTSRSSQIYRLVFPQWSSVVLALSVYICTGQAENLFDCIGVLI